MFSMSFSNNFLVFHCFCRKRHIMSYHRLAPGHPSERIRSLPYVQTVGKLNLLVGRFMGFYMFLYVFMVFFEVFRGFSAWWHMWKCTKMDPKDWIHLCRCHTVQAQHTSLPFRFSIPSRSRSMSLVHVPFHYVSLVHNGPQHFQFSGIKVVKDYQKPWLKQEKFRILIKSSKRQP